MIREIIECECITLIKVLNLKRVLNDMSGSRGGAVQPLYTRFR